MQETEYRTTDEVAALFRVTRTAVSIWIREGKLSAIRVPGTRRWLIRTADVEKLREQRDA